jgi:glycosyl transferase family 25
MSPFDFFERIFCINLDRRPERWQQAYEEFSRAGIEARVERFPGIEDSNPRRGCALSHQACIKEAQRSGCSSVLIFEDDVVWREWSSVSEATLTRAVTELKRDQSWQLFYLGGRLQRQARAVSPDVFESRLWSTHAYAVSDRAFEEMAAFELPIDVWFANTFRSYCIAPMLAVQREGFSDIKGDYIDDKEEKFEQHYLRFTRHLESQLSSNFIRRYGSRLRVSFENSMARFFNRSL